MERKAKRIYDNNSRNRRRKVVIRLKFPVSTSKQYDLLLQWFTEVRGYTARLTHQPRKEGWEFGVKTVSLTIYDFLDDISWGIGDVNNALCFLHTDCRMMDCGESYSIRVFPFSLDDIRDIPPKAWRVV